MKIRNRLRAAYVQTLVHFDEPILALLQNRKGTHLLAYAIPGEVDGFEQPYIAKAVTDKVFKDYLDQKVDLNFVMMHPRAGAPYIFDWDQLEDEVLMQPIEAITDNYSEYLPGKGFFSRNHTERFSGETVTSLTRHEYKIDGRWSASDFSRFYAKLADLYALFSYLSDLKSYVRPLGQALDDRIAKYPWQGGGSYLGFFRDIASDASDDYPLQVSKIKYASPGEIEVKGVAKSLEQIDSLVETFQEDRQEMLENYRELRGILERDGVLGSDDRSFSAPALAEMARARADKLMSRMIASDSTAIRDACAGHMVTYSKIAMAIYRRGEDLHRFYAEGRMRLPDSAATRAV